MAQPGGAITVSCPSCRQLMSVPSTGGLFQCPSCRMQLSVPAQQVVAPPPPRPVQPPQPDPAAVFAAVDKDRSGQISIDELQSALSQGGWRPFSRRVVQMMISMFDSDRSGQINLAEFKQLWNYLQEWKRCFQGFDADGSGAIDADELMTALTTFGYRFSPDFFSTVIRAYDSDKTGNIGFDEFIALCCELNIYAQAFKAADTDSDGYIQVTFEGFLKMALAVHK